MKRLLIKIFYSESERMLICLAIDTRISYLEKLMVENKFIDVYNTKNDIDDLRKARSLFKTNLFK